jgi:DNA-binding protein H-NS
VRHGPIPGPRGEKKLNPDAKPGYVYRSPSGREWDGMGQKPGWLTFQLRTNGRDMNEFAVKAGAPRPPSVREAIAARAEKAAKPKVKRKPEPKHARKTNGAARKATSRKGVGAGIPKPVKFSDGGGNTWSGMGHTPNWLKSQLEAGKTLDEFRVAA